MDKNNRYYDVIAEMVKKHRKFPGYEAILDDIVEDVYAHSEVILNSVTNESVINAYFEKVISTSIITVPKKLNFKKSESGYAEQTYSAPVYQQEAPVKQDRAHIEYVDKMINGTDDSVFEEIAETATESEIFEETLNIEPEIEETNIEDTIEETTAVYEATDSEDDFLQESTSEPIETEDNVLVDTEDLIEEEIADIQEPEEPVEELVVESVEESTEEPIEEEEEEEEEIAPAFALEENDLEENDEFEVPSENIENVSIEDTASEVEIEEFPALETEEPINEVEDFVFETEVSDENNDTEIQALELSDTNEEDLISGNEGIIDDQFLEIEEENLAIDDLGEDAEISELNEDEGLSLENEALSESDDLIDLSISDNDEFDFNPSDDDNLEESAEFDIIENSNDSQDIESGNKTDYSKFSYEPDNSAILNEYYEEVQDGLIKLQMQEPDKKISEIYDLRYKKNYKLADISEELSISQKEVIEVLDMIGNLV